MRCFRAIMCVAAAAFVAAPSWAGEENAPPEARLALSDWAYSRIRKTTTSSNRVTIGFKAQNKSKEKLADVEFTVHLRGAMGDEVFKAIAIKLGALGAGETKALTATHEFVPDFASYDIRAKYSAGGKPESATFSGATDTAQPELKVEGALKGNSQVTTLGVECFGTDKKTGVYQFRVRVKNDGDREATGVIAVANFFGAQKDKPLFSRTEKLGDGKLKGGETRIYEIRVTGVPDHHSFEVIAKCDKVAIEEQLSGGDFTNDKEMQISRFRFKRAGANKEDLVVGAEVFNGTAQAIRKVNATFTFMNKNPKDANDVKEVSKHTATIEGPIEPGAKKPFEFTIAKMPPFTNYELAVEF